MCIWSDGVMSSCDGVLMVCFFFQAEDGIRDLVRSRGLGDVYKRQVDTCARVCHSPTGYGLKTTLGESAGTQSFSSVEQLSLIHI